MIYDVGDGVNLRHLVYDADGALTSATVALTVTKPDGTTTTPAVTATATGTYDAATFTANAAGLWTYVWSISGAVTDTAAGSFAAVAQTPADYIGLDLLKTSLKIADTTRDTLLRQAISTAARQIDDHCGGRQFYADVVASAREFRTRGRVVREPDGWLLLVDDIAATTGMTVEVGDGTTWTTVTDWSTQPDNALARRRPVTGILRRSPWPAVKARITARWGWPAVPAQVGQANLMQASRLFRRKDSPEGVLGSEEWGPVRVSRIDPDVRELLNPFMLPGIG